MSSFTEQIIERLKELRDQIRYYGLIMGGIFVGLELITYYIHSHLSILNTFLFFTIKVTTLFVSSKIIVKKIKPEFFKLGMSYSQSFSLIFRLFLYGALMVGVYSFVLNRWVNPDYQAELIQSTADYIETSIDNANITDAQLELFEDQIEKILEQAPPTPLQAMWNHMWSYLSWGIFVGLILSFFTRDKDINPFGEEYKTEQEQ